MLNYTPVTLPPHESSKTQEQQQATTLQQRSSTTPEVNSASNSEQNQLDNWKVKYQPVIDIIESNASRKIVRSPPLISLNGQGLYWRRTINIVQGKFGAHKSRFAELCCSQLIKSYDCTSDFIGLSRDEMHLHSAAYVDTERNTSEQFPLAVQQVRRLAGLDPYTPHPNLIPFSLIDYPRKDRLDALKGFINEVMNRISNHLFILLDVVTDCISDFNNSSESLELFDYLNRLINDYDITFLLVIHENPGTDKARGHTGTEASNKASTIIQVGFEKGANNRDSNIIALKVLKLRNGRKPDPVYLYFNEQTHALAVATPEMVKDALEERKKKMDVGFVTDCLGEYLKAPKPQQVLISELATKFEAHDNTVKNRLKQIASEKLIVYNSKGEPCYLNIEAKVGTATTYSLITDFTD